MFVSKQTHARTFSRWVYMVHKHRLTCTYRFSRWELIIYANHVVRRNGPPYPAYTHVNVEPSVIFVKDQLQRYRWEFQRLTWDVYALYGSLWNNIVLACRHFPYFSGWMSFKELIYYFLSLRSLEFMYFDSQNILPSFYNRLLEFYTWIKRNIFFGNS